jgi:hypothetical protein
LHGEEPVASCVDDQNRQHATGQGLFGVPDGRDKRG